MKTKPGLLDFLILLLILCGAFFAIKNVKFKKGNTVMVQANGQSFAYSLSENKTFTVHGPLGPTTIQIQDNKVRITDSPCAEKTCINQGWNSPIVCLPNKVIVTIENYGEFDAVSE